MLVKCHDYTHHRINKKLRFFFQLAFAFTTLIFAASFFSCSKKNEKDIFTRSERAWLSENAGTIRYAPSPSYPPISFLDPKGVYIGVTADYIRLLEERLNINFQIVRCKTWDEIIRKVRRREVDVVGNIQSSANRRIYLSFTRPYITIPNIIIVKKDFKGTLNLVSMKGKKVVVVEGYASIDYIMKHQKDIILKLVQNNLEGLQLISFGGADAMITDLGVASYYIEKLEIANEKLEQIIIIDELTKLYNRRYFDLQLKEELSRMQRTNLPISLLMCDIDYFKKYNDTYGHVIGDDCIRAVAQSIRNHCKRIFDVPARYGGDEFSIILPNTKSKQALTIAESICNDLESQSIPRESSPIKNIVSLSVGVATMIFEVNLKSSNIIMLADEALYKSKIDGRDRVTLSQMNVMSH